MKFKNLFLLTFGLLFSVCNAQDAKEIEKQKSKLKLFEVEKFGGDLANLQKKYAGKVVFSNSEIQKTDLNSESKYITSYTFGDKLYIKAFYNQSIMNSMFLQMVEKGIKAKDINNINETWRTGYQINLYLDGKGVSTIEDTESDMNSSLTHSATLNNGIDILDNGDLKFGERLYKTLKSKFDLLTPGKHKLKLVYIPLMWNSIGNNLNFKPIAEGEIEMIIKEAKIDKNDRDVCMPTAKMNDKSIETKIINFIKSKGYKIEPKKINITSNKWIIKKNKFGIITKRYIDTYLGYIQDGKCKYMYLDINQDFDGIGYQDEIYLTTGVDIAKDKIISCECLK